MSKGLQSEKASNRESKLAYLRGLISKSPKKKKSDISWDTPTEVVGRDSQHDLSQESVQSIQQQQVYESLLPDLQAKFADAVRGRDEGHASELRRMMDAALYAAEKSSFGKAVQHLQDLGSQIEYLAKHHPVQDQPIPSIDGSQLRDSVQQQIAEAKGRSDEERQAAREAIENPEEPRELQFEDPLTAEQQTKALLERVNEAKKKLAEVLRTSPIDNDAVFVAEREFYNARTACDSAGVELPEEKKKLSQFSDGDVYYARYGEQQAKSQMHVDEQGHLVDRDGNVLDGRTGYVESAADGTKHFFDEVQAKKDGIVLHHSSEVAGGAVTAAGEQIVKDGVIREVNNKSGHYRPNAKMTHQYVQGLMDEGAKTKDESIMAIGADGRSRPATADEIDQFENVQELPELRRELSEVGDPDERQELEDYIKKLEAIEQQLQANGVGPANKDAIAQTFTSGAMFNEAEWGEVAGNRNAVMEAIKKKLGMKLQEGEQFPEYFNESDRLDENNMDTTNELIKIIIRAADVGNQHWVDKSVAFNRLGFDQFAQTGGNTEAIDGKKRVNAAIESSNKTGIVQEIDELGGERRIKRLGFDPAQLSQPQMLSLLQVPISSSRWKKNVALLGITDVHAVPVQQLVDLVPHAAKLKQAGLVQLRKGWTTEETLTIMRQLSNVANPQDVKDLIENYLRDNDNVQLHISSVEHFINVALKLKSAEQPVPVPQQQAATADKEPRPNAYQNVYQAAAEYVDDDDEDL